MNSDRKEKSCPMMKERIIDRLYDVWLNNPELRLSQLIWNKFGNQDFSYIEDEDFIKILESK